MNRARILAFGAGLALVAAFGIGVYTGVTESRISAATLGLGFDTQAQPADVDLSQFWRAWNLLEENFVQTHASGTIPTDQEKVYGAIEGMTASYDDPYTVFMRPSDAKVFKEDISGSFGGVGMELALRNKMVTVIAPLKGSPAEAAGIRSGDIVVAVDATSTENMSVEQAVKLIRGPVGTEVVISVAREGQPKAIKIPITRQTINIPVIKTERRGDGVFVIELYSFSENSTGLFRDALRQFFESGDTRLLLDLRGNPGGYLEAAVQMASYFLPVGEVVVTEDFQGKQESVAHRSLGYNVFAGKKLSMAILVDQGSASASEILAGALSQHGVGKLIGARTFGKGSVQQLVDLGGGAELKVTIARWLTPNGISISDGGLTPEIAVERTQEDVTADKDPQKDAAILWLSQQ